MKVVEQIMPDLNVRLTGNPRTSFLRPELVSMYGPMKEEISETISSGYILINTNLTLNSRLSPRILSDLEKRISPESEEWIKRCDERKNALIKWDTYNLKSTFKLIGLFGQRSPNQKVLIRPHSVEKLDLYMRFSSQISKR